MFFCSYRWCYKCSFVLAGGVINVLLLRRLKLFSFFLVI